MRVLFTMVACLCFWTAQAQKLSDAAISNISEKMAAKFQERTDSALVFVTEQMSRNGVGGLELDKTMLDLQKDPVAFDAALKYLYQYSDGNRQTLIANLRQMGVSSSHVFPIATYITNKFRSETAALKKERAALYQSGAIPKTISVMLAPPANVDPNQLVRMIQDPKDKESNETQTTTNSTTNHTTSTTTISEEEADALRWEVRNIFSLRDPEDLKAVYGRRNVVFRDVNDIDENPAGQAWVIYPDSPNEMQIVFHDDQTKTILFGGPDSKWKPPFGIRPGDPIDKITKINNKVFTVNGFEWMEGGLVRSWAGGALDKKGVHIKFKAVNAGDPRLFDKYTGETTFKSDDDGLKKLRVVVDKIAFTTEP